MLVIQSCGNAPTDPNDPSPTHNEAPSAVADADLETVNIGEEITLDASASSDPDGDNLSFEWQLDIPSGSSTQLSDDQAESPTFTPDVVGDYVATLTVDDGNGDTHQDDVTVTAESDIITIDSDITSDQTWTKENRYKVTNYIAISSGAKLTIEPGVAVEFLEDAGITVSADNSVLVSAGTQEEPVILFGEKELTGFWRGIRVNSNSVENEISHTEIRFAGSTSAGSYFDSAALTIDQAKVKLSHVTIANSGGYGIQTRRFGSEFPMDNMVFRNNEDDQAYIHISQIGYVDAASSFDGGYITAFGGSTTGDMSVAALDGAKYQIVNNVDFEDHIVIDEGATFEFGPDAGIKVRNGAVIEAVGTADNKIVFTGTSKAPGAWRGIFVSSSSVDNIMEHVNISYGGSSDIATYFDKTNLGIDKAKITLRKVSITDSDGYGIQTRRSGSEFPLESSYFENNASYDMRIHPTQMSFIDSQTNFNGGEVEVYRGDTEPSGSVTWSNLNNGAFYLTGSVTIDNEVTVQAGALFEMGTDVKLIVARGTEPGVFKAIGTAADPITFTGRSKAKGAWGGILVSSASVENEMDHVKIEYGGGTDLATYMSAGNLGIYHEAFLKLSNASIENSANYGIIVRSSRDGMLSGSGITYLDNNNDDLYNY